MLATPNTVVMIAWNKLKVKGIFLVSSIPLRSKTSMLQIKFNHFLDPVSRQSWCLTLIARQLLFVYLSWHCPCFESINITCCCDFLKSQGVYPYDPFIDLPLLAVLDIFGNNHSMRRFIPWLFNLDADLQNSHSVVAVL